MIYPGADQDQPTSYTCVATTASMACDCATGGRKRPGPLTLHAASGTDMTAGRSYAAMAEAVEDVVGIPSAPRYALSRSEVANTSAGGRPHGISIDTNVTANTSRRTGSFRGGHTVYVPAGGYSVWPAGERCACEKATTNRHSEFRVQDPGTYSAGFLQWSAELLFRAAEARTGGNGINVLVFPDTTDVYRKVLEAGWIREKPTTGSKRLRRVEVGDRPRHVLRFVVGEAWFRPDGERSTAWAELAGGGYFRGDHLGFHNVEAP